MMITKRRVKETVLDRNNTANICDDENDKSEKISTVDYFNSRFEINYNEAQRV